MLSKYVFCRLFLVFAAALPRPAHAITSANIVNSCSKYADGLKVSFLNAGQGDSVLIRCPGRKTYTLLDSGPSERDYPGGEAMFRNALAAQMNDDHVIEYAVNTHPHSDHISGFLTLLKEKAPGKVEIRTYIDAGVNNPNSRREEDVRALAKKAGTTYINLTGSGGASVEVCRAEAGRGSVNLMLKQPQGREAEMLDCPRSLNDCSVIAKTEYQGISFLFPADISTGREEAVLEHKNSSFSLKSTVLKIAHHGTDSTSSAFLNEVQPDLMILSSGTPGRGMTERYGYPEASVVKRMRAYALRKPRYPGPPMKVKTCSRTYVSCLWEEKELPNSIWSTEVSGTINAYAKDGRLCVEGEKTSVKLEIVP